MTDRTEPRPDCAAKFATLENGKADATRHLSEITRSIERMADSQRKDHDETMRAISGFQNQNLSVQKEFAERIALVESSTKSAHHRQDTNEKRISGMVKWAFGVIGSAAVIIFGLIINHIVGS